MNTQGFLCWPDESAGDDEQPHRKEDLESLERVQAPADQGLIPHPSARSSAAPETATLARTEDWTPSCKDVLAIDDSADVAVVKQVVGSNMHVRASCLEDAQERRVTTGRTSSPPRGKRWSTSLAGRIGGSARQAVSASSAASAPVWVERRGAGGDRNRRFRLALGRQAATRNKVVEARPPADAACMNQEHTVEARPPAAHTSRNAAPCSTRPPRLYVRACGMRAARCVHARACMPGCVCVGVRFCVCVCVCWCVFVCLCLWLWLCALCAL